MTSRSEKAFALIERMLKEELIKDEDVVNEMIGIITAKTPGEVALEDRLATVELTLRAIYADIQQAMKSSVGHIASGQVSAAYVELVKAFALEAKTVAALLHILGVSNEDIDRPPSEDEFKLDAERTPCNCASCRKLRVDRGSDPARPICRG